MTDAAIHRVSEGAGGVVCSITEGQWIATPQEARDDKWWCGFVVCHCEEGTQVTDAAIHRVSEDVGGVVCSLPGSQWIAMGLRPRDDKGEERESTCKLLTIVIARKERK